MRNYTKLLELAKQNNGYVFTKDLSQNKIAKDYLKFAVEDRILEKVARGIYIESDKFVDLLYVYQMNYSKIVFSSFTSAYLWNLTTRDTEIIYGATPLNYFAKYSHNNTVLVRENDDIYNLGITTIKTMFGNIVKCHDIHRTICDLFSDKYVGDKFVEVEALKNYLKLPNKDTIKLMKYAKVLGVDKQLREKLEVLL